MSSKKYSTTKQQRSQQTRNHSTKYWNKPLGKITIAVIAGIVVYLVVLLISHLMPPKEQNSRLEIPRNPYGGTVKVPTPGIYMKDVRADSNKGVGIKIDIPNPNIIMDNVQTIGNKKGGMEINNPQQIPPQKSK